jgi:hypothetical protein
MMSFPPLITIVRCPRPQQLLRGMAAASAYGGEDGRGPRVGFWFHRGGSLLPLRSRKGRFISTALVIDQ